LLNQRHIGSIPAAIFRLTFGPRPCGTYVCTASATYGTADNGIAACCRILRDCVC
jgi:hypothetical protein